MRGPPPTPTSILKLRGSWRANQRKGEAQPPAGAPPCPSYLKGEARKVWRRIVPGLAKAGIITKIDGFALSRYCELLARWRECQDFIDKHGMTHPVKDAAGNLVGLRVYPQVKRGEVTCDQLLKLEQQFGLTPSSRARVRVAEPAAPGPLDDFKIQI